MKQNFVILFSGLFFFLIVNSILAQPNYPSPTGVWCSCPPTTGLGNGSVLPAVASKSYVKGILVRVSWKDIETADNISNWALIDNQLAAAKLYGKKISLAIGSGPNSPDWLFSQGAQSISYSVPFSGTIPIPWDTVFITKWTEFIAELGSRYANDTTIQLVYITNSSTNGFEMQLPFNPTPSYLSIGYTDQNIIDSWKQVIDAFSISFPDHYLTNDFHPVNSSNIVADSIYAYAKQNIGSRYGANGWWWTQNNISVYPFQYNILQNSSATNLFTGIQMAHSGVTSPNSFGTGGMPVALNLAISNNICYWEIWNNDITSGSFDSLLSNASCLPIGLDEIIIENKLTVFPNPSQGIYIIELKKNKIQNIEVINSLGEIVFKKDTINNTYYQLDIRILNDGIYFLNITTLKESLPINKIILKNSKN